MDPAPDWDSDEMFAYFAVPLLAMRGPGEDEGIIRPVADDLKSSDPFRAREMPTPENTRDVERYLNSVTEAAASTKTVEIALDNLECLGVRSLSLSPAEIDKTKELILPGTKIPLTVTFPKVKLVPRKIEPLQTLTDEIAEQLSALPRSSGRINGAATMANVRRALVKWLPCQDFSRTAYARAYALWHIMSELLSKNEKAFQHYIASKTIIEDNIGQGLLVRLDGADETHETRQHSMHTDQSIGTPVRVQYNFSFAQLRNLLTYIFSRDPSERTKAKINLSSVREPMRPQIMLGPSNVFKTCVMEHALTRLELLTLIFSPDSHAGSTCCCCNQVFAIRRDTVRHPSCEMTNWLVSTFQFESSSGVIRCPRNARLPPGVCKYARDVWYLLPEIRS